MSNGIKRTPAPKNTCNSLPALSVDSEYRTGQSDMVEQFYVPCLGSSHHYDRAVGYFRSSVFTLIHQEIAEFAKNDGKMRIICSPHLTSEDIQALSEGYENREEVLSAAIARDVDILLDDKDLLDRTAALATLVAHGVIDVKLAIRPAEMGLYHEKIGIFKDHDGNGISFTGSSNETWNAWHEHGNFESIEVFCSWKNQSEEERVRRHSRYFDDLWNDSVDRVEVYDFPKAVRDKLCQISHDDLDNIQWSKFQKKRKTQADPESNKRTPFEHQVASIANWKVNGNRGIFEHATGSGKTFTALLCIRDHIEHGGVALVLVPSKLLLRQWLKEVTSELPEAIRLKAGDGSTRWKKRGVLANFTSDDPDLGPRIIVATMQTASSSQFISKITPGSHLMLVADECHQTGSPENSKLYQIDAGKRLGLSATPTRYGDIDGTNCMLTYFGGILEPVFTLQDAIKAGRLVHYDYFPQDVRLTDQEEEEWREYSDKITREVARSSRDGDGKPILSDYVKLLLIQRSRVAKKAANKVILGLNTLKDAYRDGDWWLVYCEDQEQLTLMLKMLQNAGLPANEYHTSMDSDQDATLEWYRKHGGIIVSIRCLDEGVDIPEITHALILASSQNPRQFIQRRGRVLRVAPNKRKAVLYDAIVMPTNDKSNCDFLPLIKSEFCRAVEFANGANNKTAAARLRKIAIEINLDIELLANLGTEEN